MTENSHGIPPSEWDSCLMVEDELLSPASEDKNDQCVVDDNDAFSEASSATLEADHSPRTCSHGVEHEERSAAQEGKMPSWYYRFAKNEKLEVTLLEPELNAVELAYLSCSERENLKDITDECLTYRIKCRILEKDIAAATTLMKDDHNLEIELMDWDLAIWNAAKESNDKKLVRLRKAGRQKAQEAAAVRKEMERRLTFVHFRKEMMDSTAKFEAIARWADRNPGVHPSEFVCHPAQSLDR